MQWKGKVQFQLPTVKVFLTGVIMIMSLAIKLYPKIKINRHE